MSDVKISSPRSERTSFFKEEFSRNGSNSSPPIRGFLALIKNIGGEGRAFGSARRLK